MQRFLTGALAERRLAARGGRLLQALAADRREMQRLAAEFSVEARSSLPRGHRTAARLPLVRRWAWRFRTRDKGTVANSAGKAAGAVGSELVVQCVIQPLRVTA